MSLTIERMQVFYHMFETFVEIGGENLIPMDFVNGFFSFLLVCSGGVAVGLLMAGLAAFITK